LKRAFSVIALMLASTAPLFAQQSSDAPYANPNLSPDVRAKDIVSRMTLDEKVLQMQSTAPAIPGLGVPIYNWWNEALHGVAQGRATVFPQAIGMGASWDTDMLHRVADAISTEARAKYNEAKRHPAPVEAGILPGRTAGLTYWSPNVNIFRDPRWGRGQETYGEDPYLTSRMGVEFVKGMQGNDPHYLKVVATPKHYAVHSGPEPLRHTFDAQPSEYDMVNTYLPAFRATITEGNAASIMCVYNSVDGVPGCASTDLLEKRLREQWGFKGYVVSDCGAVGDIFRNHKYTATMGAAAVAAVKAGTDLTCGEEYKTLVDEVKAAHITEAELDRSLVRLFEARFRLGMFDPPERVPFSKIPFSENDSKEHRALALEAAKKSIVLLKNEGGILPLKNSASKIAVVGPSADDPVGLLGNYNGMSSKQVTPLEGISQQFSNANVRYALGATYTATNHALVSSSVLTTPGGSSKGIQAEYFDNPDFQGEPKLRRTESRVNFDINTGDPAVTAAIGQGKYSVRWSGTLTPPATGEYILTARTSIWNRDGKVRLFLDDKELELGRPPVRPQSPPANQAPTAAPGARSGAASNAGVFPGQGGGMFRNPQTQMQLEGGHKYAVKVEFSQNGAGGSAEFSWIPPSDVLLAEAEKVVKDSDVAIVFVGLNSQMEGEGHDRNSIELPAPQEKLVETVIATGKPVIVVLTGGSAISANYAADHAAAVLEAWYGGEEAGTAIAETLAGINNPAGRLPVTFYKSDAQLPAFTDYSMKGRTYRYFSGDPLYSFGFGLSYSSFAYSGLSAKRIVKGANIQATVKNTSTRDGDEVVQLYVSGGPGGEVRRLRGFQRIHLRAGESRKVNFTLAADDLPKSKVEISVGGGQPLSYIPHLTGSL
jgi:beta-glucosidase